MVRYAYRFVMGDVAEGFVVLQEARGELVLWWGPTARASQTRQNLPWPRPRASTSKRCLLASPSLRRHDFRGGVHHRNGIYRLNIYYILYINVDPHRIRHSCNRASLKPKSMQHASNE